MEECGVADKLPELKKWYDGYLFGTAEIYNPWSVIRYIDEQKALRQIEEKSCLAEPSRQGVKETWKYGIAFWGKRVCIVHE